MYKKDEDNFNALARSYNATPFRYRPNQLNKEIIINPNSNSNSRVPI